MTLLNRGTAVIWSDAQASKKSIGGGYTQDAMPREWIANPSPEVVRVCSPTEGIEWTEGVHYTLDEEAGFSELMRRKMERMAA